MATDERAEMITGEMITGLIFGAVVGGGYFIGLMITMRVAASESWAYSRGGDPFAVLLAGFTLLAYALGGTLIYWLMRGLWGV